MSKAPMAPWDDHLIADYFDGILPKTEIGRLEQWLNADDAHIETFARAAFLHRQFRDILRGDARCQEELRAATFDLTGIDAALEGPALKQTGHTPSFSLFVTDTPRRSVPGRSDTAMAGESPIDKAPTDGTLAGEAPSGGFPWLTPFGTAVRRTVGYFANPAQFSVLVSLLTLGLVLTLFGITSVSKLSRQQQPLIEPTDVPAVRLVRTFDCLWDETTKAPKEGGMLTPGMPLTLLSGLAEMAFADGARVILQGPAQFSVDTKRSGTLLRGRLSARVPREAIGFTVHSPHASVVDLGTEFGMHVTDSGQTMVQVFDGRVRVDALGTTASGETFAAQELTAGQQMSVGHAGPAVSLTSQGDTSFVRRMPPVSAEKLNAFASAVLKDCPVAYWRPASGLPRGAVDLTGNGHHARVGRGKADGKKPCRYLFAADHPRLTGHAENASGFKQLTLESRFRVDALDGAVVLVRKFANRDPANPRCRINNGYWLSLKGVDNQGGVAKFHLGDENDPRGIEVTSASGTIVPGRWYHAVGTWDGQQATLYINGERQATAHYDGTLGDTVGHIGLGVIIRNNNGTNVGQVLQGQLDDVAIYGKCLDSKCVEQHHRLATISRADTTETEDTTKTGNEKE